MFNENGARNNIQGGHTLFKESRNSKLLSLSPFIDAQGIIRVGGRLQKISPDIKSPILLPSDHPRLVYEYQNIYTQERKLQRPFTLSIGLYQRAIVKKYLRKCIVCFKAAPRTSKAIMSELLVYRVIQNNLVFKGTYPWGYSETTFPLAKICPMLSY